MAIIWDPSLDPDASKWRDIARDTAWKDYVAKTPLTANLLKLALDVPA